ncbi:hypothetical protein L873DRAFT_1695346 [Choiromyces venosus 120613-1]|uniref:glucan endo-1,3-beta-D-glucosidase n=1 Tax=Choiromyces venosus 120613-1 TaxID=1336337 RepID=A0A3N4JIF5_9PEZI|nr:hypothetical protein L873DRAFT_1695346 [Choiromyces venosus 120613-1]
MPRSSSLVVGSFLALSAMFGSAAAGCSGPVINSIPYCNSVDCLGYSNIGYGGEYQDVIAMDKDTCTCTYAPKQFSNAPGAPVNEPLSIHFRGPLSLKQFAFYTADNKKSKRSEEHLRRHAHGHNKHRRAAEPDLVIVTAQTTIYKTVGPEGTPLPSDVKNDGPPHAPNPPSSKVKTDTPPKKTDTPDLSSAGTFTRQAYYNSKQGVSDGLVFMNHRGGQGSGDFDMGCLGLSISYANKDNTAGSANPECMGDITIPSDGEFIIFSDKKCEGNDCGFYRPGIPAYHGFAGDIRVFAFEFIMPRDKGDIAGKAAPDIPAIWALNAKVPRTSQYGIKSGHCSCWPACPEVDIFEALPGNPAAGQSAIDMMKTHIHSEQGGKYGGGGNNDYFDRPLDKTMKLAAIFSGENIFITKLPDNTNFDKSFSENLIADAKKATSIFKIGN